MKTGAELKARREELKITQQDLAKKIGVSRTQLSRMENGKIEIPIEIRPILYDSLYAKDEKPKLQFSDLEVGDYVYVRDDLEHGEKYGDRIFVDGMDGMIKGEFIEIHRKYTTWLSNHGFDYTPEMLDISRSMKKEDYLKMNEKEYASFEELQYVANKALDESIIEKYEVFIGSYGNKNMIIHFDGKFTEYSDNSTNSGIEFIQSLYTEEFVIECEDDIKRIKVNAEIEFKNGNKDIVDGIINDGKEIQISEKNQYGALGIFILKGATVKQSKGAK